MPPAQALSSFERLRESAAETLFQASRAFPKALSVLSRPRVWTLFRVLIGSLGAGLVVLPLSLWNAWAFAPVGLALFLAAVLLPPLRRDPGTAQAIEQLGAYLVLDGGRYSAGTEEPLPVNFFLTQTRVWVLDYLLRPLVVIPANEVVVASAFPSQGDWILRLSWKESSAEFIYDGLFAERRVRLAESGLRHLVEPPQVEEPPNPPRARARGAGA
jgi:hypothetical protein